MTKETLAADIQALLPDRPAGINDELSDIRSESAEKAADKVVQAQTAKEIAKLKRQAQVAAKREAEGIPEGRTAHQHSVLSVIEEREAREAAMERELREDPAALVPNLITKEVVASPTATAPEKLAVLASTTKADVARLMSSLNMNLNLRLSKTDMSNIVACLLTCNEAQLKAIANNPKVPVVIKTIIKRLQEDMKLGSMGTINDLWDRVFGKAGLLQDAPTAGPGEQQGLIPGTPISREAYILLRDTIIK